MKRWPLAAAGLLLCLWCSRGDPPKGSLGIRRSLSQEQATQFAQLSLHCATQEYPYKLGQVLGSSADLQEPKTLHPAFYGCFDWHSAVHGHWALVRLLRFFPKLPIAPKIRALLHEHLSADKLQKEAQFFQSRYHQTFERPYGWGWYLRLVAELESWSDPDAAQWRKHLQPLEWVLLQRIPDYLRRLSSPIRSGTHSSTAFSLVHMLDYARATRNPGLLVVLKRASRRFYLRDRLCPTAYEPSGEDFVSPCLAEADVMRRVLGPKRFHSWLRAFLPPLDSVAFQPVRQPPRISDPKDYKIGHLIGLSLQRAWALRGIASSLPQDHPKRAAFLRISQSHRAQAHSLLFQSGYGGTHWLASFAIYDLTGVGIRKLP